MVAYGPLILLFYQFGESLLSVGCLGRVETLSELFILLLLLVHGLVRVQVTVIFGLDLALLFSQVRVVHLIL